MAEDFESFQKAPYEASNSRQEQVNQFSWLFVGGYGNELARGHYFDYNMQTVAEMGATHVRAYFPSSFRSASGNLEALRTEVFRMYERSGRKPVMLFGHSKGGLESLALVLMYPELIREGIVANVTLVQAPIGGNALIDQRGLVLRLYAKALAVVSPSFRSLQTNGINEIIADRLKSLDQATLRLIGKSVRYVISHKDAQDSGYAIRTVSNLANHNLKNDGLVATIDMWLPGFGTILGELYIDHLEVVVGKASSFVADNMTIERVRAFTQSMIVNLLKSRNRNNKHYRDFTERKTVERVGPMTCQQVFFSVL